jgi:hypothetical protein
VSRIVLVRGLTEHDTAGDHCGIGPQDDLARRRVHGQGFPLRQADDVVFRALVGQRSLVDSGRPDKERDTGLTKDIGAPRRLGGENQGFGGHVQTL